MRVLSSARCTGVRLYTLRINRYQSMSARRALALLNLPLDLVCGRISEFLDFSQDISAQPDARTGTEPVGEIRGGLHE